jgi:FKBP-type peptidyl-prolyl cis-trans isomerase (trigger factor)
MKSTVKKISEININMEETIKALMIDRSALEMHIRRLTHLFKNDTQQQIEQKLRNILARDNIFNVIMNEVARSYEVTFDGDEIKNTAKQLEQHFQGRDPKVVEEIAKKAITKSLIFGEIAKE